MAEGEESLAEEQKELCKLQEHAAYLNFIADFTKAFTPEMQVWYRNILLLSHDISSLFASLKEFNENFEPKKILDIVETDLINDLRHVSFGTAGDYEISQFSSCSTPDNSNLV